MMPKVRRRSVSSNVSGWRTALGYRITPLGTRRANHAFSSSSTELLASNLRQVPPPFLNEAEDGKLAVDLLWFWKSLSACACFSVSVERDQY